MSMYEATDDDQITREDTLVFVVQLLFLLHIVTEF